MNQIKLNPSRSRPSYGLLAAWLLLLVVVTLALAACGDNTATKSLSATAVQPKTPADITAQATVSSGGSTASTPRPSIESTNTTSTALSSATTTAIATGNQVGGTPEATGGEPAGGDEPVKTYLDPAGQFSFQYPQSWGNTTKPGESVRFTGRDEFISTAITTTNANPLDFGKGDDAILASASPGFKASAPTAYKVAGTNGAMLSYTWQAGPSPVTGKMVPSSARRYYIPGPGGKLAIFTYSSPTNNYDSAGADDFANAFKWLK